MHPDIMTVAKALSSSYLPISATSDGFFDVLRAMLFYIDELPEQRHHPLASRLLFPMVKLHAPETSELIDRLDKEHSNGESAVRELQHLLLAWELIGETRRI